MTALHQRRTLWSLLLLSLVAAPTMAAPIYVRTENLKPGTSDWKLTNPGYASGAIEGYASLTSVNRGEQIRLFVNTTAPTYTIDIFRLGYYGGLGARRMTPTISRPGTVQPPPIVDSATGLVECAWGNPFVLDIPANAADPTDWMSGIYLVKLTAGGSGKQQYLTFTVRDDQRRADLLFAQTVTTYHAYNVWGGKSLYGDVAHRGDHTFAAHKVSFNRPYYGDETNGAGLLFSWEAGMLSWLEKEGYDVSYATNVDVDRDPDLLFSHKAFLSVGHDEYWSWNMVDHVEAARDGGVNLGFFSGNTSYWQVRFEPSLVDNVSHRTLVGYKEAWAQDPITPSYLKTFYFRRAPVNRSEDAMIGVMYITQARPALVVEDPSHWVFSGTGLKNGDTLTRADGTPFLGYEVDAMGRRSPANTQRLAHSPANARAANFSDMTVYRAPSGATVFAAGSIGWSQTVPQIQQITRNVLARFINGSFADTTPVRPPLPAPFSGGDIGDVGRPGFVSVSGPQSFTLNGAGQDAQGANDALYYASQPLSGDGEIVARLKTLQLFWNNRAGVMMRESRAPGSRYVALVSRPSESVGAVLEGVEFLVRDTVGVKRTIRGTKDLSLPNWLKLARAGQTFTASVSADGVSWTLVGSATVPMPRDIYIGADVSSAQHGVWATASFDNISVSGSGVSSQTCNDPKAINVGGPLPCVFPPPPTGACASVTVTNPLSHVGAGEANWYVTVTAPTATCTWTATSDQPWLLINRTSTPVSGVGSGQIKLKALPNTTLKRIGHVTVGGSVITITQGGT